MTKRRRLAGEGVAALALLCACGWDGGTVVDGTAPRVEITSPEPGAVVTETVSIVVLAEDEGGIASVEFLLDSDSLGVDESAPFEWEWTPAEDRERELRARARDLAGNEALSEAVTVWEMGDAEWRPRPFSPMDSTQTQSGAPLSLRWRAVDGAVRYECVLSTRADLSEPLLAPSSADTTLPAGVLPDSWYFWRVRARDAEDLWHGWSATFRFHVGRVFSRHDGDEGSDGGGDILLDGEGGYVCLGFATASEAADRDIRLQRLDEQGRLTWSRDYGGTDDEEGRAIIAVDGGYVIAGSRESAPGTRSALLLKTDAEGSETWLQHFPSIGEQRAEAVARRAGGGYLVAGGRRSLGEPYRLLLIETDAWGNELWMTTHAWNYSEYAHDLQPTPDGGFVISGYTVLESSALPIVFLLKLDADLEIEWQREYGGAGRNEGFAVLPLESGGYLVAASVESAGANDLWLLRTDAQGVVISHLTYGGDGDDLALALAPRTGGGYFLAGSSASIGEEPALWLLAVDDGGDALWSRVVARYQPAEVAAIRATPDGGLVAIGTSTWDGPDRSEIWTIKTDPTGYAFPPVAP